MQKNNLTINGVDYERFQEYPERTVYTAVDHTIANPHILGLSRVDVSGTDASVKTRAKFSRKITHPTTAANRDIIVTVEVSFPQWAIPAVVDAEVAALASFLTSQEAQDLYHKQSI